MSEIDWAAIREESLSGFTLAALPPTMKLPALPHAVTLFVQKSNDPNATAQDLAKIVETDTGLTLELLRHVNSSFVGLRHKVAGVRQAISLLGQRQSKLFILTTGMQAAIQAKKSKLLNQSGFWNASLQKALFAKEVALLLKTDADLAFAGSLLQDYLLPVLTNELFDEYLNFIQTRDQQPLCIDEFERMSFGWDHPMGSAGLAHRWHLPDELVCCILFHHHGLKILAHPQLRRSSVAAVALSALLPDQLQQHYHGLDDLFRLEEKWAAFNIEQLAQTVDEKHAEMGLGVRNDFPLSRRCRPNLKDDSAFEDGTLAVTAATL